MAEWTYNDVISYTMEAYKKGAWAFNAIATTADTLGIPYVKDIIKLIQNFVKSGKFL